MTRTKIGEAKDRLYKLSELEESILQILSGGGTVYGLDIGNRIEARSEGAIKVKFGSLYPALRRMEERCLVKSHWGEDKPEDRGGARRRYYEITQVGEETLREKIRIRQSISSGNGQLKTV